MKLTQQQTILALLQENEKVNSYELTYKHSIKQAPTRIFELKAIGYEIITSPINPDGSVDYTLLDSPVKKETHLKIEPERAELASNKKNPSKGRIITYYDNFGNKGTLIL